MNGKEHTSGIIPAKMKDLYDKYKESSKGGVLNIVIFILVAAFLIYIYINIKKGANNCKQIGKYKMNTTMIPINSNKDMDLSKITLNKTFIKTAYNCCCSGKYKNDYVGFCALINCAKQGVRALDFTVYSLKGKPVIAASTLQSNDYKETYNSLPLADTMAQVYQYFIASNLNCPNISDPLFLIFRVKSLHKKTYDEMATIINGTFGGESLYGNMIFYIRKGFDTPLENVLLSNLVKKNEAGCKVIIIIDITAVNKDFYYKSKLSVLSALDVGNGDNIIYRESDLIQEPDDLATTNLSILYPDYSYSSNNYDFSLGITQKVNFIGLCFQTDDGYLKKYNDIFSTSSIVSTESDRIKNLFKNS